MFSKGYSHVGRPTNEEVNNKKKKKMIFISIIVIMIVVVPIVVYFLINNENFDFSSVMGNSASRGYKVLNINLNNYNSGTLYLNKSETFKLMSQDISNKNLTWSSSVPSVALVDSVGKITPKSIWETIITVKSNDGKYKDTFKLTIKSKVIVVITASLGVRMDKWFTNYTSSSNNNYNKKDGILKYVFNSGSGFDYQLGDGLKFAKQFVNEKYGTKKNYIDLSLFFTLTRNSVKKYTCDKINQSGDYKNFAIKYNNAVEDFINMGYINTKGYVLSHSPLNTKYAKTVYVKDGKTGKKDNWV